MSEDRIFIDTNILVYAHDVDAGSKQRKAQNILAELWNKRTGVMSVQVLQEFYVTVTRKVLRPLPAKKVRDIIRDYLNWYIEIIDPQSVLVASRIEENYRISFGDALIVTAASRANAAKILSEDFQSGQVIEGILIENPFMAAT